MQQHLRTDRTTSWDSEGKTGNELPTACPLHMKLMLGLASRAREVGRVVLITSYSQVKDCRTV